MILLIRWLFTLKLKVYSSWNFSITRWLNFFSAAALVILSSLLWKELTTSNEINKETDIVSLNHDKNTEIKVLDLDGSFVKSYS